MLVRAQVVLTLLPFPPAKKRKSQTTSTNKMTPSCEVCAAPDAPYVVPERSEEWHFSAFCLRCMDDMLSWFPLTVAELHHRSLTGRRRRRRPPSSYTSSSSHQGVERVPVTLGALALATWPHVPRHTIQHANGGAT